MNLNARTRQPISMGRRFASVVGAAVLTAASLGGASPAVAAPVVVTGTPAQPANTWIPTDPMSAVRSGQTATLLPGGDVLVAGGGTADAQLYDPTTRTFSAAGSMSVARKYATATLLPDGDVLVAGGWSGTKQLTSADLYDAGTGTWSAAAPMHTARSGQTASLLPDGKVLIAGGGCNGNRDCDAGSSLETLRSAEIYDPVTDTWSNTTAMAIGREYATATPLNDGTVLVAGGFSSCDDDSCKDTSSVQIYDPTAGTWSATGRLGKPRQQATATLLADGSVLVAGGTIVNGDMGRSSALSEAEVYDLTTGQWKATPSMGQTHSGATAGLLGNGWVLVAGGGTDVAQVYEPQHNIWVRTGSMNTRRTNGAGTVLPDGDVLVTGGGVNTAETYRAANGPLVVLAPESVRFGGVELGSTAGPRTFTVTNEGDGNLRVAGLAMAGANPGNFTATDDCGASVAPSGSCTVSLLFTPSATGARRATIKVVDNAPGSPQLAKVSGYGKGGDSWAPTGRMASGRDHFAMTLLSDGDVLVAGGQGTGLVDLPTAELYNPRTGAFTPTGSMSIARSYITATRLRDGKVLVAGGRDNDEAQSSAELYDPTTGGWSMAAAMNASGYALTSTLLRSGKVLVTGLGTGTDAEVYNPKSNTWRDTSAMDGVGMFGTATLLQDGRVLVAGGGTADAGIYDPATNRWIPAAPMNTARFAPDAVPLADGDVLVAGGSNPNSGGAIASAELYDPAADTWTFTGNQMTPARTDFALVMMADGNVLAAGGCASGGCDNPSLNSTQIYNTAFGFWDPAPHMIHARAGQQIVALPSGDVLETGGADDGCCDFERSAEIYTPTVLTDTPSSGPVGQQILLRADGFPANALVRLQWDFQPWLNVHTDSLGRLDVKLQIPSGPPGVNSISAYNARGYAIAHCAFMITTAH